jgi:hypothetical protein
MLTRLRTRGSTRAALAVVVLLLLAGVCAAGRPAPTRKAPYIIYSGVATEMDVHWQLNLTLPCRVDWGTDTTYSLGTSTSTEYGTDHQHACTLTGLTPGETYYYRVTADSIFHTGSFRAAAPDDATSIRFLAYGDTRSYPADHDSVAQAMVSTFTAEPEYRTFLLGAGDLVNHGNDEIDWDEQFFSPLYPNIQELLRSIPSQWAMGNHEGTGVLFQKYFPYPHVAGRYWSFDYGPVHVVVVDQYTSYTPGSAQLTWIENDLATTTKPWKFMLLHEPGWSSGGGHENEIPVQLYLHPLCLEYGVPIVFGGHNHYYARAYVEGVHHVTTGGGGAPLRTPDTGYPYIVTTASEFHYCKVDISGDSLAYTAVMPDGTVLDSFTYELPVGVGEEDVGRLALEQNVPNPFNPVTEIGFSVPEGAGVVTLAIHNVNGQLVRTLVDGPLPGGQSVAVWDGRDDSGRRAATGVYFAALDAGGQSVFRKMILIK